MQTVINIKCIDQTLTLESSPIIASGGLHENFIMFDFCEKWDGLEKVTTFYTKKGKTYYSPVVDGLCEIPHEVTDNAGTIEFGVFGVANDVTKTSELVKYNIKQGAITETSKPSDPTPEIWEQILAVVQESNDVSKAHVANNFNPHNVTKEQVGLGNVPNVSTNDQTPTFTMAAERINIQSGDKLTIMLGKIAKIFSEIKTGAFKAVANSLDISADGYVLDARQGKILSERVQGALSKKSKDTAEGFIAFSGGYGRGTTAKTNGVTIIDSPADGALFANTSTSSGILKIILPQDFVNTLLKFDLVINSQTKQLITTYSFAGQIYKRSSDGSIQWAFKAYDINGSGASAALNNLQINFGRENGKAAISIGNVDTVWGYSVFSIKNIIAFFSNYTEEQWAAGWQVFLDTEPLEEILNTYENPLNRKRESLGILYSKAIPTKKPDTGEGTVCFVRNDNTSLPIEEGGTGATTVRGVHENLGVHDYIVEQGKSGNWYYRKWNSGIVELWGAFSQDSTAYSKNGFVVGSNALTKYPFAITEPIAQATGRKVGSGAAYITYDYERVDYWSGIVNAPANQEIAAGTTMNVSYYVHVFAKWK